MTRHLSAKNVRHLDKIKSGPRYFCISVFSNVFVKVVRFKIFKIIAIFSQCYNPVAAVCKIEVKLHCVVQIKT